MSKPHAAGSPSWFELGTTDQAGAERFYSALFGWTVDRSPMPDGSYTIFKLGGRDVGACYTLMPEQTAQGVPPHWGVYFRVDDADAIVAKVRATGGKVLTEPFEVMQHLRMAVCSDAEDAVFSLHQARQHSGVGAIREDNAVCWAELATRDLDRAETFYRGLFGWETQPHPVAPSPYKIFSNSDGQLGGLIQMTAEWGDMPSHWSIYLQVADLDATVAKAESLGGSVQMPAFDVPTVGRITRLNDPAGAGFYLIQPAM